MVWRGAFCLPWNLGGGKLEKNPILWLAVTQGMGQGRVRGERMTLVAIVHWKDEDRIGISNRIQVCLYKLGSLTKFLPEFAMANGPCVKTATITWGAGGWGSSESLHLQK